MRALVLGGAKLDAKDWMGRTAADLAKKADIKHILSLAAVGQLADKTKVARAKRSPPPARLVAFFANEAAGYAGQVVPDLIAEGAATKVAFLKKAGDAVFRKHDVDPLSCPDHHVLAQLVGEEHFLVVDGRDAACPVLLWDAEDGKFHPLADHLDAFLLRLQRKA